MSPAGTFLNLGGVSLSESETEQERKRRLAAIQQSTAQAQKQLGTTGADALSAAGKLLGLGGGYGGI